MAGTTVSVACRMPNGLVLRLYDFVDGFEQVLGGGTRTTRIAKRRQIPDVVLKGFAAPRGTDGGGIFRPDIVGGCGMTHNIDADFMAEWFKQNADSDLVKNKVVFAREKQADLKSEVVEHKGLQSGLEPLDPDVVSEKGVQIHKDNRWPKQIHKGDKSAA